MIPILFPREETKFDTNGIGRLAECVSFTVTEERNGIYEAEFKYPITGRHYADIEEGMIVYAIHDDTKTPQPFRIYGRSAPISGLVTFYAHHISYDLGHIILTPFTASTCAAALSAMKTHTVGYNPFTFWTDKSVSNTYTLRTPRPCREMLGGTEGSILDVYGAGEYEWDKFAVKLYVNRGRDTGVRIQYGKNLSSITQQTDYSGLYSAVVPFWQNPNNPDDVVTLPEQFITAPELILYSDVWVDESGNQISDENGREIGFDYAPLTMTTMDMSADFESKPTVDQLRTKAQSRLDASEAWLPDNNITVDFVQLWQTAEYANVAPLERLSLCDTVDVYYPALGIVAKKRKIVRVVYDVLLERYSSMEIGTAKVSFAETVKASTEGAIAQNYPSKSMMTDAIASATEQISGAHGGYIKYIYDAEGNPTELLIMDAPTQEQAVKIWRWNVNGLGYSSDGGQTYGLAMTQDGQIVADFITTGTMVANLIKAGILSDESGKFSLNMETGALAMDSAQLTNANVSGMITSANATITGGTINIQSDSETSDIIQLNFASGSRTLYTKLTPKQFVVGTVLSSGHTAETIYGRASVLHMYDDTVKINMSDNGLFIYSDDGRENSLSAVLGRLTLDAPQASMLVVVGKVNGVKRFELSTSGLSFYNASGTLTKTYSAT
jgi:phage minor structural protein